MGNCNRSVLEQFRVTQIVLVENLSNSLTPSTFQVSWESIEVSKINYRFEQHTTQLSSSGPTDTVDVGYIVTPL